MRFSTFIKSSELLENRLKSIHKQVKSLHDSSVVNELSTQQTNKLKGLLETAFKKNNEFEKSLNKLFNTVSDSEIDSDQISLLQDSISDMFLEIQSVCTTLIPTPTQLNDSTDVVVQPPPTVTQSFKLPPISIPTFSGDTEQWVAFQNIFEQSIHKNDSASNVEKFTYLLSCLSNEPLNLVKSLPVNAANYIIAWQTLVKRYHNPRLLVSLHVNNILDLPTLQKPTIKQLRDFLSSYNENYEALKALGHNISTESVLLTSCILRKFDASLRSEFEHKRADSQEIPNIQELISFLEKECQHREAANLGSSTHPSSSNSKIGPTPYKTSSYGKISTVKPSKVVMLASKQYSGCIFCNCNSHTIYKCEKFLAVTPQSRLGFVRSKSLCTNCLNQHNNASCASKHSCRVCKKRHHTLLHLGKTEQNVSQKIDKPSNGCVPADNTGVSLAQNENSPPFPSMESTSTLVSVAENSGGLVLLATALVQISTSTGQPLVVRAILDSASQNTIITQHCAHLLQLHRSRTNLPAVMGLSSAKVSTRGMSHVNLSTMSGHILAKSHPVLILDKISTNQPAVRLSSSVKTKLKGYTLADPSFDLPGPIDLLIGADLFPQTLLGPSVCLGNNLPYVLNTIFGYVVIGNAPTAQLLSHPVESSTFLTTTEIDLHSTLQKFWSLEEPPSSPFLSPDDKACEKHFIETHSRTDSGRYVCRIPFKDSPTKLGDSSNVAKHTFQSLERKFQKQPDFKDKYSEFMEGYKSSGHMKLMDSDLSLSQPHCFLPHHGVFKNGKIRVVFNASAPTSTGVTLNSIQHQGPKLHCEISDIIFHFRQHKIVFLCDIRQMFRQILIHNDDQIFQLIYWRENDSLPLQIYQLTTVTFGLSSSPYLANKVVQKLIEDEGEHHPLAAKALKQHIYVDDAVLGCDSVEEALELQKDVIGLLQKGGFELRKWASNQPKLLEHLPQEFCETPHMFRSSGQPYHSVLGLKWMSDTDEFSYVINKPSEDLTKRSVLSAIAQIYDPIGMLAPLIFWAKTLMQHIWTLGLDWDSPLPQPIADRWSQFISELPQIETLRIPRYLHLANCITIQLHGFSDASEAGYAASVYLRTEDAFNNVNVNLLISKSKVAPLKRVTIPRLELCGAHLLSKLLSYSHAQFSHAYETSMFAWCDSTIALSWIRTPSYVLKLFVANRVAQIQELIPTCTWKHISTNDNPADFASRGLTASNLIHLDLWFNGPQWLKGEPTVWPQFSHKYIPENELPERKSTTLNLVTTNDVDYDQGWLTKFSSWKTTLHVMGYVLRFISCLKRKVKTVHPLTVEELEEASKRVCWLVQQSCFKNDINLLQKNKTCSDRIQRLAPFLDSEGILRVGGRLKNSNLSLSAKHQIILPKHHPVVHNLIDHHHKIHLHVGPLQLQAILQEKYWILSARSVIRSRVFKCIRCFKVKPKSTFPLMGDLPSGRVVPTRCFNVSAVDYAGPFTVKLFKLRRVQPIKVYLCLFICFVSKAIHLEVVTDLSTDAFLASLTRFISRRGLVSNLHSDCGTNFIGTCSSLRKTFEDLMKKPETQRFAQDNSIRFHFNPPRAPHQGGLWERAIKSAKHHLTRVIGNQILTYEEFFTLTTRVEAMLNSRPITPLSSDPNDLAPLTPGHFLTGGPLISLIEPYPMDSTPVQRWRLVQAFAQHIWQRWNKEYLQTLQERSKWTKPQENLKIGDLVILHEDNTPPLTWKMGRITEVFPGSDENVRVVKIKTSGRSLTRPAVKVSCLPIN